MIDLVVVGLGYVGLPLLAEATKAGLSVVGVDKSEDVVAGLSSGQSHVDDLSDYDIAELLDHGFTATSNPAAYGEARSIVICVPTPLSADGGPELSAVISVTTAIAGQLSRGTLVVLESTTYPGTTEEVLRPLLEEGSGLTAGVDFHLAYSPERIDPGNNEYQLRNTPKVVGGLTPACTAAARDLYSQFIDTIVLAQGTREAEAAKLLENTYRHVNIALVNEMARFFHELKVDFWDVIELAGTKPFGFQTFHPGPGVGGHCIPIDPNYLSHRVRSQLGYAFRFVELAQEINATMPAYVAQRAQELLNQHELSVKGRTVLLLGVTYKPNISDQRESPSWAVAARLMAMGANVQYHDPYVDEWSVPGVTPGNRDVFKAAARADLTILLQNHDVYDADAIASSASLFFDTRGVTRLPGVHRL